MFARIDPDTNRVVELWHIDTLPPLHVGIDALYWPAPAGTATGDILDPRSGTFSPPPPEPLADVQGRAIARLESGCEAEIVSGFYSSALGTPHLYQSDRDDQINLIGAVATGIDRVYKCQDAAGVWDYRLHTAAQLTQVLADGAAKKTAHLQRFTTLKGQIEAATTNAEAEAVAW